MKQYETEIGNYEERAIKTLNLTYDKYPEKTYDLLTNKFKTWRASSCLMLAMKNNLGNFLTQAPCQMYSKEVWRYGQIPEKNLTNKNIKQNLRSMNVFHDRSC
uniref:TRPM-like domain-containing protein n=1 Tax=Biomphalaria glabrata TaxID=6526 RepID=A0A2C9KJX5_BIOGL